MALKAMASLIGMEILAPQSLSLYLVLSQRMHKVYIWHWLIVAGVLKDTCIYLSLQLP